MIPFIRRTAVITATTMTAAIGILTSTASAQQFGQTEVDQSHFVAVASPYRGGSAHQLLILEQVSEQRPCWSELSSSPTSSLLSSAETSTASLPAASSTSSLTLIDPLLLEFNFTGICSRSTDSNGYSIRVNGEDLGLRYSVRIVYHNGDMLLVGAPSTRNEPYILIGHTNGMTDEFAKITLTPGWRFTKRTYADRTLGHVYLTYDGNLASTFIEGIDAGGPDIALPPRPEPVAALFPDTRNDIYLAEINQAVTIGFIAGFSDNTFRPNASLTREQLVSMIIEALHTLPGATLTLPTPTASPYTDVAADRWSAAKIEFARQNNIVSGYQDGTFRPAQPVTRAELMAVLRRAAEYAKTLQGQSSQLSGDSPETAFSDTNGHWAQILVGQMSAFCSVATPLNEQGTAFAPDSAAQRNYAAAATLRMLNCVNTSTTASR